MESLQNLVAFLARSVVDDPDAVSVATVDGDQAIIFELTVAKDDLGKVIGKEGRTARAIRTLLIAAASRLRKRAVLEILE